MDNAFRDEDIKQVFSYFGPIASFSRPVNLSKHKPSNFAFIKYEDQTMAQTAVQEMNEVYVEEWDASITVQEADMQESYFTNDTGA